MSEVIMEHRIDVATDFSEFPFGRYSPDDGEFSGEVFRDKVLKRELDKLVEGDTLNVDFNGVLVGIGSSFLSESFGGAVSKGYIKKDDFLSILTITCKDDLYEEEIRKYIEEAQEPNE